MGFQAILISLIEHGMGSSLIIILVENQGDLLSWFTGTLDRILNTIN